MNYIKASGIPTRRQADTPCSGYLAHESWPAETPTGGQPTPQKRQEVLTVGSGPPSVPRSCEAGLDPETLSLRASLEFISCEFAQPGAGS
jgi:hypothetical protein